MKKILNYAKKIIICILTITMCLSSNIEVLAVDTIPSEIQAQEALDRKSLPIESNGFTDWPNGPAIGAQSAVVMDVKTGTILYSKNPHDELFPASTTKLLTGLLVIENTTMDETVTFSSDAVWNIDRGSTHLSIDVGEEISVEEALYGLLLASANEVAYALAEHVGGSMDGFVAMMNDRAAKLGCKNTHFANSNGLPREDHYTSAYDLALIARECFANETFCKIASTTKYTISPTNKQPEERPISNHHKMLPGFKYEYEGFIGGKTGYTEVARQTLVSCAERNGMRLICVVMKEESPAQFTDTMELFDYAFSSFQTVNIADNETRYDLNSDAFFKTKYDILGSTRPILTINKSGYAVIPKSVKLSDIQTEITYSDFASDGHVATLQYYMGTNPVGSASIDYATDEIKAFEFSTITELDTDERTESVTPDHKIIFINVKDIVKYCVIILASVFIVSFIIDQLIRHIKSKRRNDRFKRIRR
ncbi:MAG: D-alanyl-D-alanine carboxypeptidase family protein [Lachnospiraceae bacterium]|nr:D-alanyl-D-alanine carboxypeptidase family protein [Lachnospiraceae bacterium]